MAKRKISIILMILGLLSAISGLGLIGYNTWDNRRAEKAIRSVLEQLPQNISDEPQTQPESDKGSASSENIPDPSMPMPATEIDGYRYIGILEIPSLDLKLPVMETWDYERMRISPCRYSGSVYSNDLIIAGHNYSSHFGMLRELQPGNQILFTDMNNNVFSYTVSQTELLDGTAVEEMENGSWDLTLFTCTLGGQARVTIRCTA